MYANTFHFFVITFILCIFFLYLFETHDKPNINNRRIVYKHIDNYNDYNSPNFITYYDKIYQIST